MKRRPTASTIVLLIVASALTYFIVQTTLLRARLVVLQERQAGIERNIAATRTLLDRAPTAPPAPACPVITLVERACPARRVPTLADVEKEFGLGRLDCRTLSEAAKP